jgi:hypothetical protein
MTMSWIRETDADTPLERVLGQRPELLTRYRRFYQALWQDGSVPRRLLELTRLRIAAIHDCDAEWLIRDAGAGVDADELEALAAGRFDAFTESERAALAVAEQMPYAHHQISDADVAVLQRRLGPAAAVTLITALAFFDVACRLKLVLDIDAEGAALDAAPLRRGALI